jgi:hypothetical protein
LVTSYWVGGEGRYFNESEYLDFVIDGHSLGRQLGIGSSYDLAGSIGWQTESLPWGKEEESKLLQQLLLDGPSELGTGRTMLYVCPECGFDIGCGAITAVVEETDGMVVWRDFGFERDPDPDHDEPFVKHGGFEAVGPFRFDKHQYRDALLNPPPKEAVRGST